MRNLLILSLLLFAGGCKYHVPLAGNSGLAPDPAVTGYWQQAGPGHVNQDRHALVLRYSDNEYLVYYEVDDKGLYFRAYPVNFDDRQYVQIQLVGTSSGSIAVNNRKYDVLRYEVKGDFLSVWLLNSDVIDTTVDSKAELREALHSEKDNPDLFRKMGDFKRGRRTDTGSPDNE